MQNPLTPSTKRHNQPSMFCIQTASPRITSIITNQSFSGLSLPPPTSFLRKDFFGFFSCGSFWQCSSTLSCLSTWYIDALALKPMASRPRAVCLRRSDLEWIVSQLGNDEGLAEKRAYLFGFPSFSNPSSYCEALGW